MPQYFGIDHIGTKFRGVGCEWIVSEKMRCESFYEFSVWGQSNNISRKFEKIHSYISLWHKIDYNNCQFAVALSMWGGLSV